MTKRPLDILDQVLNRQPVIVSLKGGREIRGILQGYDVHMNLVLDKAEETENGQVQKVGTLIVRGDNVIYISPSLPCMIEQFCTSIPPNLYREGSSRYTSCPSEHPDG